MRSSLEHAEALCRDLGLHMIWPNACRPSALVAQWQADRDPDGVLRVDMDDTRILEAVA